MDYKEKVIALLNSQELSKEQKEKLEEIFPKLKGSEDDRIRKALIKYFHGFLDGFEDTYKVGGCVKWEGLDVKDVIAWLEKQAEHANFRNKIQIGDKVTRNRDGVLVNLSQLNRVAKKQDEQKPYGQRQECVDCQFNYAGECKGSCTMKRGEQKPADVDYNPFDDFRKSDSEINPSEFDARLNTLLKEFESLPKEELVNSLAFYLNVVQNDGTYNEQKPADKDEPKFKVGDTITDPTDSTFTFHINAIKDGKYIESDKDWVLIEEADNDYILVEQKPDWSKEDEEQLGRAIYMMEQLDMTKSWDDVYNWLKSLRPQNTWKPSKEQIKVVNEVMNHAADSEKPYWNDYIYNVLKDLIKQLKKL